MRYKKLFLTDIDGTLVSDKKQISAGNKKAILQALYEGNAVAICTGRAHASAELVAKQIPFQQKGCFIISFNGSIIFDCYKQQFISRKGLLFEDTAYLFKEAQAWGIHVQTYSEHELLTLKRTPEMETYIHITKTPYRILNSIQELKGTAMPKILLSASNQRLLEFQAAHRAFSDHHLTTVFSDYEYLEYMPEEVSKGQALERLAKLLELPLSDTVAIGDQDNDISMIRSAGVGISIANGITPLKETADYVTTATNNESGVSEALYKFVLETD